MKNVQVTWQGQFQGHIMGQNVKLLKYSQILWMTADWFLVEFSFQYPFWKLTQQFLRFKDSKEGGHTSFLLNLLKFAET